MFFYDPTFIILIPAIILSLWAQSRVTSTFNKYSKVNNRSGMTGADIARRILNLNGLTNVKVERVSGNLTDHYDPRENVVRLSDATFASQSVGAIGVAAHEVGHAIQHATGYSAIRIRNAIVPAVNFCNMLSMPILLIGLLISATGLIDLGIIFFSATVLFQLITLPVEFNASKRAIATLEDNGMLIGEELSGAKKVLSAAAMTYVAAAVSSILSLIRILLLFGGRRRD